MTSGCGISINFSIKESTPGTWQSFSKLIGDDTGNVDDLFDELLIEFFNIFPVMKKKYLNENLSILNRLLKLFKSTE